MRDQPLARLKAERGIDPARRLHLWQRVETHDCVAELARAIDGRFGKPSTEAGAASGRPDIEPFQLGGAVRMMLDRRAADELTGVTPGDEECAKPARERGEFVLEVVHPEVAVADPRGVLAEHLAELDDVAFARVGDQDSA